MFAIRLVLLLSLTTVSFVTSEQDLPDDWKSYIDPEVLETTLQKGEQWNGKSNLLEGDIAGLDKATVKQAENMSQDLTTDSDALWPNGRVAFVISGQFDRNQQRMIIHAMLNLTKETGGKCIQFSRRRNEDNYIHFQPGSQCQSLIGRRWNSPQKIELAPGCVTEMGTIQHEIMHALGFFHEMSRNDRDQYINIIWSNIEPDNRDQFAKYRGDEQGLPYDYESVMHYPFNAFALNTNRASILPKKRGARIGQRKRLSRLDVVRIRKAYSCGDSSGNRDENTLTVDESESTEKVAVTSQPERVNPGTTSTEEETDNRATGNNDGMGFLLRLLGGSGFSNGFPGPGGRLSYIAGGRRSSGGGPLFPGGGPSFGGGSSFGGVPSFGGGGFGSGWWPGRR
ncbi:hatching enzyme 1.2-like [Paramacrobiotus metropolitanus]|uniref:hatching enzyme 1.2-like n=1 Tax=Paramacrobiotus metropolitanus TaxID=2943436 RepID=UPI002445B0E1|nr:hatching enzyme 1.2-like [Paramacrobiotus metropolitanus]